MRHLKWMEDTTLCYLLPEFEESQSAMGFMLSAAGINVRDTQGRYLTLMVWMPHP